MATQEFVDTFGGVYENANWVAELAWKRGIGPKHDSVASMAALLRGIVAAAPAADRTALIRGHPELGAQVPDGRQGEPSRGEQARAGLSTLSADESRRLRELNRNYRDKFGFTYVMAVGGLGSGTIFAALERRLAEGTPAGERTTALAEIDKIAFLRLEKI